MPKFTQLVRVTFGAILFSFTAKVIFSHKVLAELACYMTLADGRTINLNQLCEKTVRKDSDSANYLIDLKQDTDRDGISDALVDEVKRIESAQDKTAAIKDFFNRVPFSPKTQGLLTQAEALQQRLAQTKDKAEMQQIFGQLQNLKQQMMHDPIYVQVNHALR